MIIKGPWPSVKRVQPAANVFFYEYLKSRIADKFPKTELSLVRVTNEICSMESCQVDSR